MEVFGVKLPVDRGLTDAELLGYAQRDLKIPYFRGVYMRDSLPRGGVLSHECGIMNFNKSTQPGSHWVCYYRDPHHKIYFDSFGQITPMEIQKYLKTPRELEMGVGVIERNTDIVQHINSHVCGQLCLFVLTALSREHRTFQSVIQALGDSSGCGYGCAQGYREVADQTT